MLCGSTRPNPSLYTPCHDPYHIRQSVLGLEPPPCQSSSLRACGRSFPLHDLTMSCKHGLSEASQMGQISPERMGAGVGFEELSRPHPGTLGPGTSALQGHGQLQQLCLSALRKRCTAGVVVCFGQPSAQSAKLEVCDSKVMLDYTVGPCLKTQGEKGRQRISRQASSSPLCRLFGNQQPPHWTSILVSFKPRSPRAMSALAWKGPSLARGLPLGID